MAHHHPTGPNSSPAMLHPTHTEQRFAGSVLNNAKFNKGTAFTLEERNKLKLRGLLPPTVESLERQMKRVKEQFDSFSKPIDKYVYLASLKERNETLFYAFTIAYMDQAMPIIYTPTVGEACIRLSHNYRVAEGMYFSRSDKGMMRSMLDNWRLSDVAIIVVTDGSRILGLGDLGANGMGIPVGKLSLYVAAAGFHPALTLPIMLDFGTNNEALLADDLYIGQRHNRLPKEEYYSLVDEFLMAVKDKWPRCLLQFEDFSNDHCFDLLENYRNKMLCFNDDIQGTGAVVGSGFLNAVKLSGVPIRQHRIVFYGAGSAGVGVASQIAALLVQETGCTVDEARQQFWFVDSRGLVTNNRGDKLEAHKVDFARKDIPADGQLKSLIDVIKHVKPTALIGLSGQGGAFNQEILLEHFKHSQHPIVFPLSNPTKNSECTAKEAYTLSEGRALFASGSPFDPVEYNGHTYYPGQGNNMYIFPGLGFGAWLCHAKVVTDEMITAASRTLANCTSPDDLAQGRMYPPISRIRDISAVIAARVIEMAFKQGVAQIPKPEDALTFVRSNMWWPEYRPIEEAKL